MATVLHRLRWVSVASLQSQELICMSQISKTPGKPFQEGKTLIGPEANLKRRDKPWSESFLPEMVRQAFSIFATHLCTFIDWLLGPPPHIFGLCRVPIILGTIPSYSLTNISAKGIIFSSLYRDPHIHGANVSAPNPSSHSYLSQKTAKHHLMRTLSTTYQ